MLAKNSKLGTRSSQSSNFDIGTIVKKVRILRKVYLYSQSAEGWIKGYCIFELIFLAQRAESGLGLKNPQLDCSCVINLIMDFRCRSTSRTTS